MAVACKNVAYKKRSIMAYKRERKTGNKSKTFFFKGREFSFSLKGENLRWLEK